MEKGDEDASQRATTLVDSGGALGQKAKAEPSALDETSDPAWMISKKALLKTADILSVSNKTKFISDLATSQGGLLQDEIRQIGWPLLLGSSDGKQPELGSPTWKDLPRHKDEDQLELDVNRSFIYYPRDESEEQIDRRKHELSDVISEILRRYPMLCYFQGFHDIVQVFLLALGPARAVEAVAHLCFLRIRDFMLSSLAPSLAHLHLLPSILCAADADLHKHLSQTQPFFALGATLTLYAHDIEEYRVIARLFDFLLAQEAVVSLYLFVAIVVSRRDELFGIPADEPDMLHFVLSKLPKPLDFEPLISKTMELFHMHPPERLPFGAWRKVSSYSVLKTTRGITVPQTLREGQKLFMKQALQLQQRELVQRAQLVLWQYRRSAGSLGLAILIGVFSLWLRKTDMGGIVTLSLRKLFGSRYFV